MRNSFRSLPCIAVAMIVSVAADATSRAQSAAPNFDGFLAGITECRFTTDYDHFKNGVVDRFANEHGVKTPLVNKSATVPVPAALVGAINVEGAQVRSEDGGESTSVDIPVQGSFNGLPLKNLQFVLGNENGIAVAGVEFAAPRDAVVKTFSQAIKRGSTRLKKNADGIEMSVGFGKPPAASIYCDQSN
jgi:hypothetical protein